MFNILSLTICALLAVPTLAIPIDNGIEGDPEVQCGNTDVAIVFNTRNPFEGHVYVKGLFNNEECRSSGVASIAVGFNSCNTRRERSLEPNGIFVSTTIIIQFHPLFVTKVDRAFTFSCFYMEADKTVSQDLEVSALTTGPAQTQNVPMPVCRYDILDGPGGAPVQYAVVGQSVYHKWTCVTDTVDTFCMVVHSCYVDDGAGDQVDLLDGSGCAIDKFLLRNLEYPMDLMAGQETHVFKYADHTQLFFQCQIALSIKEADQECPLPECPVLGARLRRSASDVSGVTQLGTIDVHSSIDALDLQADSSESDLPFSHFLTNHRSPSSGDAGLGRRTVMLRDSGAGGDFCLSPVGFAILAGVTVVIFVGAIIVSAILCLRKSQGML